MGAAASKVLCVCVINDELGLERERMIFCTKCRTNNVEGAGVCVNCGTALYGSGGWIRLMRGVCDMSGNTEHIDCLLYTSPSPRD